MAHHYEDIPLANLAVDRSNARLIQEQDNENAALLALVQEQGPKFLVIAADIVAYGLSPLERTGVVKSREGRYIVLEGNRRIAALKALETPGIVAAVLTPAEQKKLAKLSDKYLFNPIRIVPSTVFGSEDDSSHWVQLNHTGENKGAGRVPWLTEGQGRWKSRHGSQATPATQIMSFVETSGSLSEKAKTSGKGIVTNLERLINSPSVRELLGIEFDSGEVKTWYPREEIAKALSQIVDDLKTRLKVGDIYTRQNQVDYVNQLPEASKPDPATRLAAPIGLLGTDEGTKAPKRKKETTPSSGGGATKPRSTLVPRSFKPNISEPRIRKVLEECKSLDLERYTNACSVLLRVFVELGVDEYIERHALLDDGGRRGAPLKKKLEDVAKHLRSSGKIEVFYHQVLEQIAEGKKNAVSATLVTMNQYVHNPKGHPSAGDLRNSWDELQPLLERLWP